MPPRLKRKEVAVPAGGAADDMDEDRPRISKQQRHDDVVPAAATDALAGAAAAAAAGSAEADLRARLAAAELRATIAEEKLRADKAEAELAKMRASAAAAEAAMAVEKKRSEVAEGEAKRLRAERRAQAKRVLEDMTCLVCKEPSAKPVRLCSAEHPLCLRCVGKISLQWYTVNTRAPDTRAPKSVQHFEIEPTGRCACPLCNGSDASALADHTWASCLEGKCVRLYTSARYMEFHEAARVVATADGEDLAMHVNDVALTCRCQLEGTLDGVGDFIRHQFVCAHREFVCHVGAGPDSHANAVCTRTFTWKDMMRHEHLAVRLAEAMRQHARTQCLNPIGRCPNDRCGPGEHGVPACEIETHAATHDRMKALQRVAHRIGCDLAAVMSVASRGTRVTQAIVDRVQGDVEKLFAAALPLLAIGPPAEAKANWLTTPLNVLVMRAAVRSDPPVSVSVFGRDLTARNGQFYDEKRAGQARIEDQIYQRVLLESKADAIPPLPAGGPAAAAEAAVPAAAAAGAVPVPVAPAVVEARAAIAAAIQALAHRRAPRALAPPPAAAAAGAGAGAAAEPIIIDDSGDDVRGRSYSPVSPSYAPTSPSYDPTSPSYDDDHREARRGGGGSGRR